jgi:hypothetical protein
LRVGHRGICSWKASALHSVFGLHGKKCGKIELILFQLFRLFTTVALVVEYFSLILNYKKPSTIERATNYFAGLFGHEKPTMEHVWLDAFFTIVGLAIQGYFYWVVWRAAMDKGEEEAQQTVVGVRNTWSYRFKRFVCCGSKNRQDTRNHTPESFTVDAQNGGPFWVSFPCFLDEF